MTQKTQYKSYNIEKFLSRYNIEYKFTGNGIEIVICCLWHDDIKYKLAINSIKGVFHCWTCGEKGNFYKFLKEVASKQRAEIKWDDFLEEPKQLTVQSSSFGKVLALPIDYYPLYDKNIKDGLLSKEPLDYLAGRKITDQQISYYSIGFSVSGRLNHRIIVPIVQSNNIVSYVARAYKDFILPKVLTPYGAGDAGVKQYVFNLDRAASLEHLMIGEGVFDAISLGVRGVCLFGKAATPLQLAQIISKKPRKITICLDNDAELEAQILARQLLFHCPDVKIASLPLGQDPNSISKEQLNVCLSQAKAVSSSYALDFI